MIIIYIIILVLAISAGVFFFILNKKEITTDKQEISSEKVPSVDNPLAQSNIPPLSEAENFEATTASNSIKFDSIEIIMKNFELFTSIYFPKLDLKRINEKLKTDKYKDTVSVYNKTVQQILIDNATNEKSRQRFRLKPIIDIYSRIILDDVNDENINKNFELAMIGMVIFLNAKEADKAFNKNGKTGTIIYKYNPDYKEINELRIFMTTEHNKDKELLYTDLLNLENDDCFINKLCYTTSKDLKKFYMISTKTKKSEQEDENKKERENKKKEVKTESVNLNDLLDIIFISNLIYIQDISDDASINAVVNNLIKTIEDKDKYRGLIQKIINKKNIELTITTITTLLTPTTTGAPTITTTGAPTIIRTTTGAPTIIRTTATTTKTTIPKWVDKGCWIDSDDPVRSISQEWINVQFIGLSSISNFNNNTKININSTSVITKTTTAEMRNLSLYTTWINTNQPKYLDWAKNIATQHGFDVIGFQNDNEIFFGKQNKSITISVYNDTLSRMEDTIFTSDYTKYGPSTAPICPPYGSGFTNHVWQLE